MVTFLDSPAFKNTLAKPFSSLAGRNTSPSGLETYSWATSAPSISPVFLRVKLASFSVTVRLLYSKVV